MFEEVDKLFLEIISKIFMKRKCTQNYSYGLMD